MRSPEPAHNDQFPPLPAIAVGPRAHSALALVPDWCQRLSSRDTNACTAACFSTGVVLIHVDDDSHFVECARICAALRAAEVHPLVVALAARPEDPRYTDGLWLHRLSLAWNAVVIRSPFAPETALERVAKAWTENLALDGLIGFDFANLKLAPRVGVGELLEWTVQLPLTNLPSLPLGSIEAASVASSPLVMCTMRTAVETSLEQINDLARLVNNCVPADADILWAAPIFKPAMPIRHLALALTVVSHSPQMLLHGTPEREP